MPGTSDAYEAQYNIRLRHPDRGRIHQQCLAESAAAYARLACVRDVRYGEGQRALLDYFPAMPGPPGEPRPLVAFFHGGFWHAHERSEYALVAGPFVRAGIATAIVGYDLAPQASLDGIVDQARAACAWLQADARKLGFDPNLIFTAGHSAGAHLAACAMTQQERTPVLGAVLISGIFELEPLLQTSLNAKIGLDAATARRQSPIHHVLPERGDIFVAVGDKETHEFMRQSDRFASHWRSEIRQAVLVGVPDVHHYDIVLALGQEQSALARQAVGWVGEIARRRGRP